MNSKITAVLILVVSTMAQGQQAGGTAAGGGAPAAPATPATPATPAAPATPAQPNQPNQAQGLNQPNQIPILAQTNRFGLQSQFGNNTNQFGLITNQLQNGFSNQTLTPTGATNRIFGTNAGPFGTNIFSPTNNGGFILQDSALTAGDRSLLIQVRQNAAPQLTAAGPWAPVNFMVRNSVVTLVGYVATLQERQQIEASVRTTAGVLGVVNSVRVINQDVAVGSPDRALLVQVRQALQPLLPSIGTAPLRFIIRDGNVTLVGSVPSADLRQQIETTVAQVPGVVAIVNRSGDGAMSINRTATVTTPAPTADGSATVGSATPASGVTIVPPAAFPTIVATNQFGTGGALPPTGRVPGPINTNLPVLPNVTNVPPAPAPRTP